VADPSDVNWTSYGPLDQGTPYADTNSSHGIGAWDNQMTVGQDVAMNDAAREKYGIRKYTPNDPSTKDQWFQDRGQWWHYADNVPERYSDARVDVFKGRYDGAAASPSASEPISGLPERLDLSSVSGGVEGQEKTDYEAYRRSLQEAGAEREKAQDPDSKSIIEQYIAKHPNTQTPYPDILRQMHQAYAPTMPLNDFIGAVSNPGGIKTIKDWNERQKDPIDQIKDKYPELRGLSDDQLSEKIYQEKVANKELDPSKLSLQDFKYRMKPPQDWWNQSMRFATELWEQAGPKTQAGLREQHAGIAAAVRDSALPGIKDAFTTLGVKPEDMEKKIAQYQKLGSQEARSKQFFEDLNQNPQTMQSLKEKGIDPLQMAQQLTWSFDALDRKGDYDKFLQNSEKIIGDLNTAHAGTLPDNQQKALDLILSTPSLVLTSRFPGLREAGLWGYLYRGNVQAIKQANPQMPTDEINQRARDATAAQFPTQEVLSLIFGRGGPAAAATITNKALAMGTKLGASAVGGGTVFGANQVIQNIAAGRDPRYGLGGAVGTGFAFGLAGQAAGLTVEGLSGAFKASPEIRKAMNISSDIVSAEPAEANKILGGDPSAEVHQKATLNAVDMILSASQQRAEEKRLMSGRRTEGEIQEEETAPGWQRQRERDILSGRQPKERGYEPAPNVEPEQPVYEISFQQARELREKGDVNGAAQKVNEGLAQMTPEEKKPLQDNIASTIKAVTKKGQKLEQVESTLQYFGVSTPKESRQGVEETSPISGQRRAFSDIQERRRQAPGAVDRPGEEGAKLSLLGLEDNTATRAMARRALKADQGKEALIVPAVRTDDGKVVVSELGHATAAKKAGGAQGQPGFESGYVTNKGRFATDPMDLARQQEAEEVEPSIVSLGITPQQLNPFQYARGAANLVRGTEMWKRSFDWVSKNFAPQRRGQEAEDTAGLIIKTSGWKPFVHSAISAIADDLKLDQYLRNGSHGDRRDAFWGKFSDSEKAAMQTAREKGAKVSDPIADKLFDFYRDGYDWMESLLQKAGVKMGHIDDYFHHAFKDPVEKIDTFIRDWERQFAKPGFTKERNYPTIEDAIAAGLKPKSYSPERNFVAYQAAAVNALRQIQALDQMEAEGLAIPTAQVKEQGLTVPDGWHQVTTPDKKTRWVSDGAYGVISNAFDMKSVYSTMGGPFTAMFRALKIPTGLKLSWSAFHALHITTNAAAESLTTAQERLVMGKSSPAEFLKAIGDVGTFGVSKAVSSVMKYGRLTEALEGKISWDKLSEADKGNMRDLMEMGVVPHISAERQRAFASFIFANRKLANVGDWLGTGYKIATCEPYQKWLFGKVIPSMKIAAALARRDTLLLKYGEKLRGEDMNLVRAREYSKVNRDIEGRFGEMLYDNLFWKRTWKQIGLAVPLSLGWNLGFWRVYGDGIVDFTRDAANVDRIASRWKRDPNQVLTNRLMYAVNYTAMSMLTNGLISYAFAGGIKNAADWFFPRIGTKKNGEDERVRTPYWTGEWSSMYEHWKEEGARNANPVAAPVVALSEYFGNKLNPGLASVWHYLQNKDFSGRTIVDWKGDNQTKKLTDTVTYFLHDMFLPISVEQAVDVHGVPTDMNQRVWSFFGFGPAAGWASRTELENQVMAQMLHRDMSPNEAARYDAKAKLQYALLAGDKEMAQKQIAEIHQLGGTRRMVEDAIKNAKISPVHRAFHALGTEKQVELMKHMSKEELSDYWQYATKDAKVHYSKDE
jgi:hypothetical protein